MIRTVASVALLMCVGCEGSLGAGGSELSGVPGSAEHPTAGNPMTGDGMPAGGASTGGPSTDGQGSTNLSPSTTPVARLTNREFVASISDALGLAADTAGLQEAADGLPAEPKIGGLRNDASAQLLSQVVFSSYSSFVDRVAELFLGEVEEEAGLRERLSCATDSAIEMCVSGFVEGIRESAFRRPLTDEERGAIEQEWSDFDQLIVDTDAQGAAIDILKLRLHTFIRSTFLSPDFLLQVELGLESASPVKRLHSNEIATRLSYFLTGTAPDAELRAQAASGALSDPAVRLRQATRLMNQPAAREHVVDLVVDWLGINERSTEEWDDYLSQFIGGWFDEARPFSDFYQGSVTVSHLDGSESEEPLGVLGSRAFLASHTIPPTAAFITRGVVVVENLLCSELPTDLPVEAFNSESVTDVEVFTEHAQLPCATCHRLFDNYGAALHQFDLDSALYVPGPSSLGTGFSLYEFEGTAGVVDDAQGLAKVMASSERAARCVADFWYRSATRRGLSHKSTDEQAAAALLANWRGGEAPSLKALLLDIVGSERFATLVLPQ